MHVTLLYTKLVCSTLGHKTISDFVAKYIFKVKENIFINAFYKQVILNMSLLSAYLLECFNFHNV